MTIEDIYCILWSISLSKDLFTTVINLPRLSADRYKMASSYGSLAKEAIVLLDRFRAGRQCLDDFMEEASKDLQVNWPIYFYYSKTLEIVQTHIYTSIESKALKYQK